MAQKNRVGRTRVNVPMVMKVSFRLGPSLEVYSDLIVSLMFALRLVSSSARLAVTARVALEMLPLLELTVTFFLVEGCSASATAFRFLPFVFVGSAARRLSMSAYMTASSSGDGFRVSTSCDLSYFAPHDGHNWYCLSESAGLPSLRLPLGSSLGEPLSARETVFKPAWEKTQPHVEM